MPDAEVVPPGIDLSEYAPRPPTDRRAPVVVHAPSSRRRKGTEHVIAACEQLPVDLQIVEGLHHDEARKLYEGADIVVDQLNAGWYGLFAIEAMALGKPVVTFLHDEAVARTEDAFGTTVPIVSATAETLADRAPSAGRGRRLPPPRRRGEPRVRRARARHRDGRRPPARHLRSALRWPLGAQVKRLGKHTAVYGLGGLVSRILAVLLLPLYTHYLGPRGFGKIETIVALTTVLVIVLRFGISSAFFRFYFDTEGRGPADARRPHLVLVHDGDGDRGSDRRLHPRRRRSPTRSRSATTRGSSAPRSSGSGRR